MKKSKVDRFIVGGVGTNCYFFANTETKECVIVDPADNAASLHAQLNKREYKPVAILLTHGHFDHIMAAEDLRNDYEIPVIAHEAEADILESTRGNLSGMFGCPYTIKADRFVKDGEIISLAGFDIKVLHTPGHTTGGCCYYVESEGLVFSGDTLFCESIGRTDFPTGSMSTLVRSIKEKLMPLPDETKVYPGHEGFTDIGYERDNNPFL